MGGIALSKLALLLLLAAPASPLSSARASYQAQDYRACIQTLEPASHGVTGSGSGSGLVDDLAQVELYLGLCHYQLANEEDAAEHFQSALQLEPTTTLPPTATRRAVAFFKSVAARVKPRPRVAAKTPAKKPLPADAPTRVSRMPPDAGVAATAPPPSIALPVALGSVAVGVAAVALTFGVLARADEKRANDNNQFQAAAQSAGKAAQREALVANIGIAVASAAAVGAIIAIVLRK